jgi:hypothetical protein
MIEFAIITITEKNKPINKKQGVLPKIYNIIVILEHYFELNIYIMLVLNCLNIN